MVERKYQYKDFVDRGFGKHIRYRTAPRLLGSSFSIVALNNWDFDTLFSPEDYSTTFTKYLGPQSMGVSPQTREQWHEDLTTGFVGQNYKEWKSVIKHYFEDVENRSAIVWCNEKGVLVDGEKYDMDYIMRYEFDEDGRLEKLHEHTDSDLQKGIHQRWMARLEKEKENGEKKRAEQQPVQHRRFFLITIPRSASNLLIRILALDQQPDILPRRKGGYFFLPTLRLMDELKLLGKNLEQWTEGERRRIMQTHQDCFTELEKYVEASEEQGKLVLVKEHSCFMTEPTSQTKFAYGQDSIKEPPWTVQIPSKYAAHPTRSSLNETIFPDEYLKTWRPTFLIRHPALLLPSHYRTIRDLDGVEFAKTHEAALTIVMTLHWARTLYDWYLQNGSDSGSGTVDEVSWPLVLDADDIMTDPDVVIRFCNIVGLDTTRLRFTWTPANDREMAERRMFSTLLASNGVLKEKTWANIDIDTEAKKWKEEFGEEEGQKMEKWVRDAMPDYIFMKARRLRPKPRS